MEEKLSGRSVPRLLHSAFSFSANFLEALIVTVIAGFYIAAQPQLYRDGVIKLLPQHWRGNAQEAIDDITRALRLWLIGELIEMALIGLLSALAVWLVGLPSPLALGVIAGVAELVPYLGPVIASIPALLVATTKGPDAILWTGLAYLLLHQIEGNFLVPLIQRRMVFIPPAVMLLSIVTILIVCGAAATIFAGPIVVIISVGVKKLYIRETLGEGTLLPGEKCGGGHNSDGLANRRHNKDSQGSC